MGMYLLFWRWLLIKGKSRLVSSCPPVCPALAVCFPIVSALFLRFRCPMFSVVRPILACLPSLCFSAARPFSFCPPSLSLLSRPASSAQRFPSVSISQDFHTASTAPVCPLASIAPGFPYSELRSCLSTREHCSELSTHSGFHSVSSAPVFTREHCSGFSTRSGSTHFYFTREHCFRALHPLWVYTFLRIILEHHCTQREHPFATIQVVHRLYLQWLTNTRGTISVASMGFGPTSVAHISSLR